jgi:hypothetical protein
MRFAALVGTALACKSLPKCIRRCVVSRLRKSFAGAAQAEIGCFAQSRLNLHDLEETSDFSLRLLDCVAGLGDELKPDH